MPESLTYKQFGERAILMEWPAVIDEKILAEVLVVKNKIKANSHKAVQDFIIGYNSLTVVYSDFIKDIGEEVEYLKSLASIKSSEHKTDSKIWEIPVCYDDQFGIDLEAMSGQIKLSKQEIIDEHSKALYKVFFIGFLPGFMYLGGLDKKLFMPRKETPRLQIEKGSVGIGGSQTGIYPAQSAGGWNIIGKTPIPLFDVEQDPPCFVKPGDQIRFKPISLEEFKAIESDKALKFQSFNND